jgi:anti-anti-sigma factor
MTLSRIPAGLQITERATATGVVLELVGSLDADTAGEFGVRLHALLDHGTGAVDLHMAGVRFVEQPGIGSLICAFGDFERAGRELHITHLTPELRQMLEMLHLLDYIKSR